MFTTSEEAAAAAAVAPMLARRGKSGDGSVGLGRNEKKIRIGERGKEKRQNSIAPF